MAPFGYRVRAEIIKGNLPVTDPDNPPIIGLSTIRNVKLTIEQRESSPRDHVILRETGFETEELASQSAIAAKSALRAAAVGAYVSMLLGNDKSTTYFAPIVVDRWRDEHHVDLRGDVHGIDVFDEGGLPISYGDIQMNGYAVGTISRFIENLESRINSPPIFAVGSRDELASEIYLLAAFETSDRARFIGNITALEVLAERTPRPKLAIDFVEECISRLKDTGLEESLSMSLRNGLSQLRIESISSAVRSLVVGVDFSEVDLGGRTPIEQLTFCYQVRSGLVHNGTVDDEINLSVENNRLRLMVRTILLARM